MPNPEAKKTEAAERPPEKKIEQKAEAKEKSPDVLKASLEAGETKVAELKTSAASLEAMMSKADPQMAEMLRGDLDGIKEQIDGEEKKLAEAKGELEKTSNERQAAFEDLGKDEAELQKLLEASPLKDIDKLSEAVELASMSDTEMMATAKGIEQVGGKKYDQALEELKKKRETAKEATKDLSQTEVVFFDDLRKKLHEVFSETEKSTGSGPDTATSLEFIRKNLLDAKPSLVPGRDKVLKQLRDAIKGDKLNTLMTAAKKTDAARKTFYQK